jgi:2-aminoadipate transaminase
VAVTPETGRWDHLFAARTRGDVGEGIAFVLSFLGRSDLISFAGGFPDPQTFPREHVSALLEEFLATGESVAFQYTPTRGLAGTLDAVAGRLETVQGRRPADDELVITSGAIEALDLVGKSFLDRGDTVVIEAPTYSACSRSTSAAAGSTSRSSGRSRSIAASAIACSQRSSGTCRRVRAGPARRAVSSPG